MGFGRTRAAFGTTTGLPGRKAVLVALAYRACDTCGIAWPGVPWIVSVTEMSERAVQGHLAGLADAGLVTVRRYGKGGRRVVTEYIVLPHVGELSTAPCGQCAERMKNPATAAGLQAETPQNLQKNPAESAPHQSEIIISQGSPPAPVVETALAGRESSSPPPNPGAAAEDARRRASLIGYGERRPKGADRGKAQG